MKYLLNLLGDHRVRARAALAALLAAGACGPVPAARAADWPMLRGNRERTGFTREQAYPPLTAKWSFQIQGDVISSPVVYKGIVYVGARSGSVYALNAATGELLWDYSTGGWVDATPAAAGAAVYVPSRDGSLYALDRLTGEVLWSAALGAPAASSPLVLNGRVYVGTGIPENKLKVFDAPTGAFLWEYRAGQPVDSSPSTDGRTMFFGSNDGKTYAVDPFSAPADPAAPAVWEHPTSGFFGVVSIGVSSPSVYAVPSRETGRLYRLDIGGGSETGVFEPFPADLGYMEMEVASPVLSPDRIYYGAGTVPLGLFALSKASLEPVWTSTPSLGNTSMFGYPAAPSMADDIIYAGTADQRLLAISSSGVTEQEITLAAPSHTSPAIANGYVYIGTMGGELKAYKAAKASSISQPEALEIIRSSAVISGFVRAPALAGYRLEYGAGTQPGAWVRISSAALVPGADIENGPLGAWNAGELDNGLYTLRLTVLDDGAAPADNTAEIVVRVNHPPLPPAGLTAADRPGDSGNTVQLAWTASAGAVSYNVYRSTGAVFSLLASTGSVNYLDRTAATGVVFVYRVRAWDGWVESDDSLSASASAVNDNPASDSAAPARTLDLAAVPGAAGGQVLLSWTAPGDDELTGTAASYSIRYSTAAAFVFGSGAVWKDARPVSGPAGTPESELVSGLAGGVTYYFALRTVDLAGNPSPVSTAAYCAAQRDFAAPGAPANLSAADTPGDTGGSVTLRWDLSPDDGAGADDVYGYKIYRGLSSGEYVSTAPYAVAGKGVNRSTDTAAAANIRYYYAVAAYDSTNDSALSNEADAVSADNYRYLDKGQGGSIRLDDGAQVLIPRDGVSQSAYVLMQKVDPRAYLPLERVKANTGVKPTSVLYEIKFSPSTAGAVLLKNVTVTLPYSDADIAGMNEENLRMYTLAGDTWLLFDTSRVDAARNTVTAEVNHFSLFRVMEYVPGGALISADTVYTYPNPAKGAALTFKFRPAYAASVKIDVYNVAGEKVARLEKASCPAGVTSELQWNIENIASGVYVYIVEAESAAGSKKVTKKLAIIH